MSAHLTMPRVGHIEQVIHMLGYLKLNPKRKIEFDAAHPSIDERRFKKYNWYDFYCGAKKQFRWTVQNPWGTQYLPTVLSTPIFLEI